MTTVQHHTKSEKISTALRGAILNSSRLKTINILKKNKDYEVTLNDILLADKICFNQSQNKRKKLRNKHTASCKLFHELSFHASDEVYNEFTLMSMGEDNTWEDRLWDVDRYLERKYEYCLNHDNKEENMQDRLINFPKYNVLPTEFHIV